MRTLKINIITAAFAATISAAWAPGAGAMTLEEGFISLPDSARPHTLYHLMNGNVTKEGVTCDFEALADAGIGASGK